jgi:hypothetical protein
MCLVAFYSLSLNEQNCDIGFFVRKIENIILYLFVRVYVILLVFYVGLFGRTEYIYVCANVNPIILG